MSGGAAQCTVDMMVATALLLVHNTQATAMVDQPTFEDARPREKGDVHGPQSVVRDQTITTSPQVIVAHRSETEIDIPGRRIALTAVVGLQIGIPTATAKDLGSLTATDRVVDHARENTVTHTVKATHIRVKTARIGRQKIDGRRRRTVGDHSHRKQTTHLNMILRKSWNVLGSHGHQNSRTEAVTNNRRRMMSFTEFHSSALTLAYSLCM